MSVKIMPMTSNHQLTPKCLHGFMVMLPTSVGVIDYFLHPQHKHI